MGKVYIPQYPRRNAANWVPDLTPAAQFGNLEYVFEADQQFVGNCSSSLATALEKMRCYDPDTDYILWPPSSPLALLICVMALSYHQVNKIRYLTWDRVRNVNGERVGGVYVPVVVDLDSAIEILDRKGVTL